MWIAISAFVVPLLLTAFGLVVHNLPRVNATGSNMRLASRIAETSNKCMGYSYKNCSARAQTLLELQNCSAENLADCTLATLEAGRLAVWNFCDISVDVTWVALLHNHSR